MLDYIFGSFEFLRYSPVSALIISTSLLYVLIFTTTIPKQRHLLRYVRLLAAIPGMIACAALAFPLGISPSLNTSIYVRLAILGGYGLLRFFDLGVVGFWDEDISTWVLLSEENLGSEISNGKILHGDSERSRRNHVVSSVEGVNIHDKNRVLPLPNSLKERHIYTLDLLITIRGTSMLKNRAWNWASREVLNVDLGVTRVDFLKSKAKNLVQDYVIIDLTDTITKTRPWNTQDFQGRYLKQSSTCSPITSLPLHQQLIHSVSICIYLFMAVEMGQEILALVAVGAFRSYPSSWPPLFIAPFSSNSLTDFWSNRWHSSLKRWFTRCAEPATWIFESRGPNKRRSRWANFARAVVVFALSMGYHVIMPMSLPLLAPISTDSNELHNSQELARDLLQSRPIVQWSLVGFFLAQPIGMFLEYVIVFPVTKKLEISRSLLLRRLFFWSWMLWTGRWFSDGWVCGGVADQALMPLPFSVVRGIIYGKWLI